MQSGKQMTVGFISALLVRRSIGYDQSALDESFGPTGKRRAGKLACAVWSGGKAARPYLSLLRRRYLNSLLSQSGSVILRGMTPRQPYPTDLSDKEWDLIKYLVPAATPGDRPEASPSARFSMVASLLVHASL